MLFTAIIMSSNNSGGTVVVVVGSGGMVSLKTWLSGPDWSESMMIWIWKK